MPVTRATPPELEALARRIDEWADRERATNPLVLAVDHTADPERWYLRMRGEDKDVITVWLTLRERTLHFETYFMPAPEVQIEACFEYLLRVNAQLFAWRFSVGAEDAVYLVGQLPVTAIDDDELDRIVGAAYAYSEQYFAGAMSIGFAGRYQRRRR